MQKPTESRPRGRDPRDPRSPTTRVGFVIEAQVNGSVGTITNTATLTSSTPDPVAANNTDAVNVVIKGGTGRKK